MNHCTRNFKWWALTLAGFIAFYAAALCQSIPVSKIQNIAADFLNCELTVKLIDINHNCESAGACISIEGGLQPYTITFSNSNAGPRKTDDLKVCFENLAPGNYVVKVTDAQGCEAKVAFDIPVIEFRIDAKVKEVSCNGGNDGAIYPQIYVDVAPLYFKWTGPDGFYSEKELLEGIPAGLYKLSVTTWGGACVGLGYYEVKQPRPISIKVDIQKKDCGQPDACVFVKGGTAPYHIWALPGLTPGIKADQNGKLEDYTGLDPAAGLLFDPTHTDTAFCAYNIPDGKYFLLVVDSKFCYSWLEVDIKGNSTLQRGVDVRNAGCAGINDGVVCYKVGAGTPPYTTTLRGLNYSKTFTGEGDCFEGLAPGHYWLVTVDAGGCSVSELIEVKENNPIEAKFNTRRTHCDGSVDGCLKIDGGTAPYKIWVWNWVPLNSADMDPVITFNENNEPVIEGATPNRDLSFGPDTNNDEFSLCAKGIPPGHYLVLIIDTKGCHKLLTIQIPRYKPLEASFVITNQYCNSADGCLKVSGGMAPYKMWMYPRTGIAADEPPLVTVDDSGNPVLPNLEPIREVEFGPSPNTDFVWCAKQIPAGNYWILVWDAKGCFTWVKMHIPSSGNLEATFVTRNTYCDGSVDGCLKVGGGTAPYQVWAWHWRPLSSNTDDLPEVIFDPATGRPRIEGADPADDIEFGPDPDYIRCAKGIPAGHYLILVVDAQGCYKLLRIHLPKGNGLDLSFKITSAACAAQVDGCLTVNGGMEPYKIWVWGWNSPLTVIPQVTFDAQGNPTVENADPVDNFPFDNAFDGTTICAKNIPAGYYLILVVDAKGCYALLPVLIPRPGELKLETSVKDAGCSGENDGAIKLGILNGQAPYLVVFSDGTEQKIKENYIVFEGLAPGTYGIKVQDAAGCTGGVQVKVGRVPELKVRLDFDKYGRKACVTVEGGQAPYHFAWVNMENNRLIGKQDCVFQFGAGVFLVTVQDAGGCSWQEIMITDPMPCEAGKAVVDPEKIQSGQSTTFILEGYTSGRVQWQFKTAFTSWINIEGATGEKYETPAINTGLDKEIQVRALVTCPDGDLLYSQEATLKVIGNQLLEPMDAFTEDSRLFDPEFRKAELMALEQSINLGRQSKTRVFPSVTQNLLQVAFDYTSDHPVSVGVYNNLGQLVYTAKLESVFTRQLLPVDLSAQPAGAYFIRIESEGNVEVKQVLVTKQ